MITEMSRWPNILSMEFLKEFIRNNPGSTGIHESILRSYNILHVVRDLLIAKTPPTVILELIDDMERIEYREAQDDR